MIEDQRNLKDAQSVRDAEVLSLPPVDPEVAAAVDSLPDSRVTQFLNQIAGFDTDSSKKSPETENQPREFQTKLVGLGEYSQAELQRLRAVTKEDYAAVAGNARGRGLINAAHEGTGTWSEHKLAMDSIFSADTEVGSRYQSALEAGVVNPRAFAAEIQQLFRTQESATVEAVTQLSDIKDSIAVELQRIDSLDNLQLTATEQENIQAATFDWAQHYVAGYPDVSLADVAQFAQENAQHLAYQVIRDKEVFSGSDHGDLHILEGDYKKGMQLLQSLEQYGITLTPKEKAIWGYAVFLHDIGYTAGVAQAKQSFEASKDHPVFSVSYIEANRAYITERFGADGFAAIREIILMHSYPNTEFNPHATNADGLHIEAMSHALALPDSLGTTAETKCPEFFRQPAVITVLQQIRLYGDLANQKYPEAMAKKKIGHYVENRKVVLMQIAEEAGEDRKDDYIKAINDSFNSVTVDMTLGLYAGVLDSVSYIQNQQEKIVPRVVMKLSETQATLADVFGDKVSVQAFVKALKDLGFAEEQYHTMAVLFQEYRATTDVQRKAQIQALVDMETPNAQFSFDLAASVDTAQFTEYTAAFKALENQTLRKHFREILQQLQSGERSITAIQAAYDSIVTSLDSADLAEIGDYLEALSSISPETSAEVVDDIVIGLATFTPQKDLDFLQVKEI